MTDGMRWQSPQLSSVIKSSSFIHRARREAPGFSSPKVSRASSQPLKRGGSLTIFLRKHPPSQAYPDALAGANLRAPARSPTWSQATSLPAGVLPRVPGVTSAGSPMSRGMLTSRPSVAHAHEPTFSCSCSRADLQLLSSASRTPSASPRCHTVPGRPSPGSRDPTTTARQLATRPNRAEQPDLRHDPMGPIGPKPS